MIPLAALGDNTMRILIAEDDQVLADGLLRSLRNLGYAVDQVGSGTEADAALASHEFDMVILDLGLPDLDGIDVLRELRVHVVARCLAGVAQFAPLVLLLDGDAGGPCFLCFAGNIPASEVS